jgi:hypothetical protein
MTRKSEEMAREVVEEEKSENQILDEKVEKLKELLIALCRSTGNHLLLSIIGESTEK